MSILHAGIDSHRLRPYAAKLLQFAMPAAQQGPLLNIDTREMSLMQWIPSMQGGHQADHKIMQKHY